MFSLRKRVSENLIFFTLISFVFMSVLGIGVGMEVKDGQMASCPFVASQTSICQMNITEHISQWQQSFLGVPTKANLSILALLLLSAVVIPFTKTSQNKQNELAVQFVSYRKTAATKIFDPLLLAFSDGILNPKTYELAHI